MKVPKRVNEPDHLIDLGRIQADEDNDYLDAGADLLFWTLGAIVGSLVF